MEKTAILLGCRNDGYKENERNVLIVLFFPPWSSTRVKGKDVLLTSLSLFVFD